MATYQQCVCCQERFHPRAQNPNQAYCPNQKCQKARKAAWQREKLKKDKDYQENQKRAQEKWRRQNPDYYRDWRAKHPKYTAHNRTSQQQRNRKRQRGRRPLPIAKMDASIDKKTLPSGVYKIEFLNCKNGCVNGERFIKIKLLGASTA